MMGIDLTYEQKNAVITALSSHVERCLRNLGMSADEWRSNLQAARAGILAADSRHDFETSINRLLRTLNLSHTGFEHVDLDRCSAGRALCATYTASHIDGTEHWVFQDVHEDGPAHQAGICPGDILLAVGSTTYRPPDHPGFRIPSIASITLQTHHNQQIIKSVTIPGARSRGPLPKRQAPPAFTEPAKVAHGRLLASELGYLKVAMFPGNIGIDVANEMEDAVDELGPVDRLIIDMRGNGGGGVGFLRLLDLLSSGKREVGTFIPRPQAYRTGNVKTDTFIFDQVPRSKLQLLPLAGRFFWRLLLSKLRHRQMSICLETRGKGDRPFHRRVVILTNRHTASASEMFVAAAQEHKLAIVVGEPTGGRVRGGTKKKLPHGFRLMLPAGEYHTFKGTPLEGAPIQPDVLVSFSPEAAREGRDLQLERAIEVASTL